MPSQLQQIQDELRRRFQRPRTEMDERLPDGRSVYEAVRQVPKTRGGALTPWQGPPPVSQPAALAQGDVRPRMVNPQPSDPEATRQRAVSFDPATQEPHREFYQQNPDAVAGATGYRDALEKWKPPKKRSLKTALKEGVIGAATAINANPRNPIEAAIGGFGAGAISGVIQPNAITRAYKLNRANQQLEGRMGEAKTLAQTQALQTRPGIQQDAQNEREINNALSQYNRLESYDPDDPNDGGLTAYFQSRGLKVPKKMKGSNVVANWSNGRLVLTDKTTAESRDTTVTDRARTPNEQGLNPNQAATIQTREAEGKANRGLREQAITAANTRAANAQAGMNTRAANAQSGANARASGRAPGGVKPKSTAAANRLVAKYNQALADEIDYNKTRSDVAKDNRPLDPMLKARLQSRREVAWQEVMDTHPGMFESDAQGRLKPKAGQAQSAQATPYAGRTMSQANLARYAKDKGLTVEQAKASPELRGVTIR